MAALEPDTYLPVHELVTSLTSELGSLVRDIASTCKGK